VSRNSQQSIPLLAQNPVPGINQSVDFSQIRYAQCWEDADVLLSALDVQPHHTCLSVASGGDNTLALLGYQPQRVIAIDFNPAQIACLALRVAAYRTLNHPELLILIGSTPAAEARQTAQLRVALYQRCRPELSPDVRQFWDDRPALIQQGIGTGGKFERYLALFRRYILPLIHDRQTIDQLLQTTDLAERQIFYANQWNTRRWRLIFHLFFSRWVMGRLGRDPRFFKYAHDPVAASILQRTNDVLQRLDPAQNSYLQWIATGFHATALPYALRPENFERIRNHLDRLEWYCVSLDDFLTQSDARSIDCYNLSNIFEWMSLENYQRSLKQLIRVGRTNSRLVYWNLLVDRQRPVSMAHELKPLTDLATSLYQQNHVFFYKTLVIEEIQHC
jgi:S-adenosylmethionine-diacylglycerol 3-amino-3-carboxypropyl transferase